MIDHTDLMRSRGYGLQATFKNAGEVSGRQYLRDALGVLIFAEVVRDSVTLFYLHRKTLIEVRISPIGVNHPEFVKFEAQICQAAAALQLYGV